MKVVIREGALNFVTGGKQEMEYISNACGSGVVVHEVVNGLTAKGSNAQLYAVLLAVCAKYDVDLI